MKRRKMPYPSDITAEQFERIRPLLESAKRRTKPRETDLHEIFNAILYLLKSGCQWRMLPGEYPNWKLVHYYFTLWRRTINEDGETILDRVLKKIGWRGSYKTGAEIGNELFNR